MDLTVRDVAGLLGESETTVYRWAREGLIPAYRVHDQYRFNRVEIQEWAATRKRQLSPELFTPAGAPGRGLVDALKRGGVHRGLSGSSRVEVFEALTMLPGIPAAVDRKLLLELMVARESEVSTGIGDGVAIPHPRYPLVAVADTPSLVLAFPAVPVDFQAPDKKPVTVLFLLLTPTVRAHLEMLSRLAFCLHDAEFRQMLRPETTDAAILARLGELESKRDARAGRPPPGGEKAH
ncbi:MAG: PTS sugar transporter subunit IIA [Candidatus Wallbacteria bacterium]|nr:PTS sugar transporter subunit IIA [Candidatus Wallbacteria bacterium]